jgi:hypothetical protein
MSPLDLTLTRFDHTNNFFANRPKDKMLRDDNLPEPHIRTPPEEIYVCSMSPFPFTSIAPNIDPAKLHVCTWMFGCNFCLLLVSL